MAEPVASLMLKCAVGSPDEKLWTSIREVLKGQELAKAMNPQGTIFITYYKEETPPAKQGA